MGRIEYCILPLEPVPFSFGQMRLLQQMALKKCVIVSNVPSIIDYVKDNDTAIIYEPHNPEDLEEKIHNLHVNILRRKQIENNAFRFIKDECNEKEMAKKLRSIYY